MSIDVKPSHELQIKICNEQIKKHNELKIIEISKNELRENNPFNKDIIPRLNSNSNLSKTYESEQNYPGVVICNYEYKCEGVQYDYESPNTEESYLINENTWPSSGYEIEESCSKNDPADITYDEYTSFMDRVKELQLKLTRT